MTLAMLLWNKIDEIEFLLLLLNDCEGAFERQQKMRDMGVDKLFQSLLIYSDADLTEVYVELRLSSFQVFVDICSSRFCRMYLRNEYLRTNSISSSLCVLQHLQLICYQVHSSLYFCGYFFSFYLLSIT